MIRETLYRRKPNGRYEAIGEGEKYDYNIMPPQGYTLTYRKDGATQWEYAVRPDNAGFKAAAMVVREAMEDAIRQAATYRPQTARPYTKKQMACIERFKVDMGMAYPTWWGEASAREIVQAGLDAVGVV